MAVLETILCNRCGETKTENRSIGDYDPVCRECRAAERDSEMQKYLAKCAAMTLEERLARLESIMFIGARTVPHDGRIG